jgi:glycoside/pentoside/hexuronide:cation symporter, GPH family
MAAAPRMDADSPTASLKLGARQSLAYGLLGLPLAFVSLPLYVLLPHHYAREFGLPLATLGALLLAARLADALIDPVLGRWIDRCFRRSARSVQRLGLLAALLLALGLTGLFLPPVRGAAALLAWAAAALVLTYSAYSLLAIAHQAWGARLGGDEVERSRIVAWREGAGLFGVVLASALPAWQGLEAMLVVFAASLALACLAWWHSPRPLEASAGAAQADAVPASFWRPWQQPAFRGLLGAFVLNGIATAVPATLVLFFIEDRLQAAQAQQPVFLLTYFLAAALGLPLWLRLVRVWGLARCWLIGMGLSVTVFGWAAGLGAGDLAGFWLVCLLSGLALGADLALPGALLAGLLADTGERDRLAATYFGWWNFATKLNLALAAGLALPLLGWWGYEPGSRSPQGLQALSWAYAVLPCLLKLLAAGALWRWSLRSQISLPRSSS